MASPIITSPRPLQKSVKLTEEELKSLVVIRTNSNSDVDFAYKMNIDRVTLIRIINNGSGSEANIKKIRRKLSRIQTAA